MKHVHAWLHVVLVCWWHVLVPAIVVVLVHGGHVVSCSLHGLHARVVHGRMARYLSMMWCLSLVSASSKMVARYLSRARCGSRVRCEWRSRSRPSVTGIQWWSSASSSHQTLVSFLSSHEVVGICSLLVRYHGNCAGGL